MTERKKLEPLDVETVKKEYSTQEATNAKGQKRLRVVLQELEIPKEFKGRRVYVQHDYDEGKYYLMHSALLGICPEFKAALKAKRDKAQAELNEKKLVFKDKIKSLKRQIKEESLNADLEVLKNLRGELADIEEEFSKLPKRVKLADVATE